MSDNLAYRTQTGGRFKITNGDKLMSLHDVAIEHLMHGIAEHVDPNPFHPLNAEERLQDLQYRANIAVKYDPANQNEVQA